MFQKPLVLAGIVVLLLIFTAGLGYWTGQRTGSEPEPQTGLWDTTSPAVSRRTLVVVGTVKETRDNTVVINPLNGETGTGAELEVPLDGKAVIYLTTYDEAGKMQAPRQVSLREAKPGDRIDMTVNILTDQQVETPTVSLVRTGEAAQ